LCDLLNSLLLELINVNCTFTQWTEHLNLFTHNSDYTHQELDFTHLRNQFNSFKTLLDVNKEDKQDKEDIEDDDDEDEDKDNEIQQNRTHENNIHHENKIQNKELNQPNPITRIKVQKSKHINHSLENDS